MEKKQDNYIIIEKAGVYLNGDKVFDHGYDFIIKLDPGEFHIVYDEIIPKMTKGDIKISLDGRDLGPIRAFLRKLEDRLQQEIVILL